MAKFADSVGKAGIDKKRGYKSKASEPELMGIGSRSAHPEGRIPDVILIE